MREAFVAREQQLHLVKQSLSESEARNAAESRELTSMLQECRTIPQLIPPIAALAGSCLDRSSTTNSTTSSHCHNRRA